MPALVAGAHEERRAADRPADQPLVDAARARSDARRRGTCRARSRRAGPAPRAASSSARASASVDAERLFRMDVLAGRDRLQADLDMRLRHGEVEDDLDRRDRRAARRPTRAGMPNSARARLGGLGIGVGERDDVEDRETSSPPSDRRR